jgi:hypothetical protein
MKFRLAVTMSTSALSAWRYVATTHFKKSPYFTEKGTKLSLNPQTQNQ